jgi:hypothetical protein
MKPFLCSLSIASPIEALPYAETVMQAEQEQRENRLVHALGIDLHPHDHSPPERCCLMPGYRRRRCEGILGVLV